MRPTRALPLAALLFACSSSPPENSGGGGGGGATPTGPISGAVTRYTYSFDLATARGKSAVDVEVAPPGGDCFTIGDRAASVDFTWNGAAATSAAATGSGFEVCGAHGVRAGEPLSLGAETPVPEKRFFGLDVGFSRKQDKDGGEFTYLLSWVGGCDRFGPCDADPSRLAAFHFDITHAPGDVVTCPGTLTEDGDVTRCDIDGTLAPTYSAFGFAADPLWKRANFTSVAGADLVFYETPSGRLAKSLDAASVGAFIGWITGLLGPLPYGKELRYAGGPTVWLGFEHPANIVLNEGLPDVTGSYADPTMHVLMHETVHQWAGDRATIASTADFVWKEATAEYLAYVFEDEQRPPDEAKETLAYWDGISLHANHYPRPTDDPAPAVQDFYGDVYGPGPMVLYVQLEALFGRNAILDGIASFLAEPGARSVADLKAALSESAGQDLTAYFDAWVFGAGKPEWPTLAVTTEQSGSDVKVTVEQQNVSGKLYGCKVDVEVQGATQKVVATIDFGAAPTSPSASATVTLAEPVTGTVLDPGHKLIARAAPGSQIKPPPVPRVRIL